MLIAEGTSDVWEEEIEGGNRVIAARFVCMAFCGTGLIGLLVSYFVSSPRAVWRGAGKEGVWMDGWMDGFV